VCAELCKEVCVCVCVCESISKRLQFVLFGRHMQDTSNNNTKNIPQFTSVVVKNETYIGAMQNATNATVQIHMKRKKEEEWDFFGCVCVCVRT
jgi:heme/copper-type cytochrome/quinol oxidase subunit 4